MDPMLALDQQLRAFMTTQLIHTAVRTGIVDALLSDQSDAAAIAARIDGEVSAVLRVLRGLVVLELAQVDADGRFSARAPLELLGSDATGSLRDAALFRGGPSYAAWLHLGDAVRDGASPFERAHGAGLWAYMAANADEGEAFNGAMRGLSQLVAHALAAFLTLGDEVVIDIGGGHGHLVGALLDANQDARGIVLDQPHLEPEVTRAIAARGHAERCRFVGGDFFAAVPSGDVYLLKWILHDWSDEDCRRILGRCREAIASDGRVIILERPLPELQDLSVNPTAARAAVMMDLQMLAMGGPGTFQERTHREYAALLDASGFQLRSHTGLVDDLTAFVATPD
jgi:hypothetical protein